MVDQLGSFASEVTRVAREVGTEGRLGGKAVVRGVAGTWKDLTDNVNIMADNLTSQVRNIAEVTTAVARGDLSRKITVNVRGEILELKNTVNTMVDQLGSFASEVTRVAREVGTEGKLGGQAQVQGAAGIWEDLTDNVNMMAANLTSQVRGIAKVVTAVANGDLKRKLTVEAKGEIADLADTINEMIDTLATFADQVITVAREVGVEGRLGGQASVPGAAGTWKDLTDNVNQTIAVDGTKVQGNASRHKAMSYGYMTQEVARLRAEIDQLLKQAQEVDAEDDAALGARRGDEWPAELRRREDRLATIEAAMKRLEAEAKAAAAAERRRREEAEAERQRTGTSAGVGCPARSWRPPRPRPRSTSPSPSCRS